MTTKTTFLSDNLKKSTKKTRVFNRNDRYNLDALKERLANDDGAALDVFALAGVPSELVEHARQTGRERATGAPCPLCGGRDRFKLVRRKDGGAGWLAFCRQCGAGGRSWNPFDFYQAARGLDVNAATREIVDSLDGAPSLSTPKHALTIQAAPPIMAKPSARITATTAGEKSKKGLRVVPEAEARPETRDYIYRDESSAPVFNARRVDFYDRTTGERVAIDRNGAIVDKSIFSLVPDGAGGWTYSNGLDRATVPPYNLPQLLAPACQCVYIVEGEKSAERLQAALAGYDGERVATTTGAASNAGRWTQDAPQYLTGKAVFILSDNDAPGRRAAEAIANAAADHACGVFLIDFSTRPDGTPAPAGYDVADYLDDLERVDLSAIASNYLDALAVPFTPSAFSLQREKNQTAAGDPRRAEELDPIERRREREAEQERRAVERETLLTLPPYPAEAIPDSLLEYAQFYAAKFNAPVSTAVKQALANFSGLVARLFPMTAPAVGYTSTRPLRCNLSVLTIADSGGYKSPLFDALFEPIAELQRTIEKRQEAKEAQYCAEIERQEAAKLDKKKTLSKYKRTSDPATRAALEKRLDELDETIFSKAEEPRRQQELYIDPETPEGSLECVEINLLSGYQNAPIIATDEGSTAFIATYNPNGILAAFKKYSKLEDGSRFKVKLKTKKASGDNSNPEARLAAFNLAIQPEVLSMCFKNDALRYQGFLNRFLIDDQSIDFNAEIVDEPLDETIRKRYFLPFERAFQTCLYHDAKKNKTPNAEAETGAGDLAGLASLVMLAQTYSLDEHPGTAADPSALDVFRAFRRYCREKQAKYYRIGNKTLVSFYSKLQKIVLKYAVLFRTWEAFERKENTFTHFSTSPVYLPFPTIDAAIMRRAVDVATWDGLKREAVGALVDSLNENGGAALPVIAQRVFDTIAAAPEKLFSKSELVEKERKLKGEKNARKFNLVIKRLINDGLIKEIIERRGNNLRTFYQFVQIDPETLADTIDEIDDETEREGARNDETLLHN